MKTKITVILSVLVFATGLGIYVSAHNRKVTNSFVVTYSHYRTGKNTTTPQVWVTKVTTLGKVKTTRFSSINGVLTPIVENPDLNISSDWTRPNYSVELWKKFTDSEFLKSRPGTTFIREDKIVGLPVYVTRVQQGGDDIELWQSPQTGPIALKIIINLGDEGTLVTEATDIKFQDVSDDELK